MAKTKQKVYKEAIFPEKPETIYNIKWKYINDFCRQDSERAVWYVNTYTKLKKESDEKVAKNEPAPRLLTELRKLFCKKFGKEYFPNLMSETKTTSKAAKLNGESVLKDLQDMINNRSFPKAKGK